MDQSKPAAPGGGNAFRFRIRDGFDEFVAGKTVRVTADGVTRPPLLNRSDPS